MYGSNTGSSWANPQQNQPQQQQQQSAFGQPSAFGSGGAFGGSAFGHQQQPQQPPQQQQQQQPQVNPMFGNLSNPGNTGGGFGAFGQPKPATGFGAFGGGTGAFGGTGGTTGAFSGGGPSAFGGGGGTQPAFAGAGGGAFGSNAGVSTGAFGPQPSTSTGAFGNTGNASSAFGMSKPTGVFGAPTSSVEGVPPVTTGTVNPAYNVHVEKDITGTNRYQSISCMPQYRNTSHEELRLQDYAQGRRTAGGFGQSSFGPPAQNQPTTSTGFLGQQPQNQPVANPMFGNFGPQPAAGSSTGSTGAFGAFGQQNQGAFGGGGAFGQNQQQNQPQQPAFGAFGQPQQQPQQQQSGGPFGGTFGAGQPQQQKSAFGGGGGGFGSGSAFGGGSAFGQPQNQPQGGGVFGQPQQQPQPQQTGAFGAFGQSASILKPSVFGSTQPTQTTGFGAFGQQQQPGQQQQGNQPTGNLFGGGLFGQAAQPQGQQQQPQTGNLFGQPAQQQSTGGGLFGSTNTGGGLFGSAGQQGQQQQQQAASQASAFGLFGGPRPATTTQPTGGGLFGSAFGQPASTTTAANQPTTSIFGTPLGQQQGAQQTQPSFFGRPATTAVGTSQSTGAQGGFFGSTLGASTGILGTSALGQPAQGNLTASIAQPIGSNLPIFSILPPGPRAVDLSQPKKKGNYFADIPTRSPFPNLHLRYTPPVSKLRGFNGSTATAATTTANGSSSLLLSASKPNALSLSKSSAPQSLLGTDAFLTGMGPSAALGSGARKNVKKLTLDKKTNPSDLFSKSAVTFSPALGIAARQKEQEQREKEAAAAAAKTSTTPRVPETPTPAPRTQPNRFVATSTQDNLETPSAPAPAAEPGPASTELKEGDYWTKPSLETLKRASYEELVAVKGLVVGRVGYGQIEFLDPVNLTNVPKLAGLLGELVRFDDHECAIYPDLDESEKPPSGTGLNVRARISLVRCWALDKATRDPIKDEKHPLAVRHYKRLKNMKFTHFEDFDVVEGKWTFTVDHF